MLLFMALLDDSHVSLSDDEVVVAGSEPSTVTQSTIAVGDSY
jgi:hypothetical protein